MNKYSYQKKLYYRCTKDNTDYVLARETDLKRASEALSEEGYEIRKPG